VGDWELIKQLQEIAQVELAENEVHLFHSLTTPIFPDDAPTTLGALAEAQVSSDLSSVKILPPDQISALGSRYSATPIWELSTSNDSKKKPLTASIDLAPAVRTLLDGVRSERLRHWSMTDTAVRFLNSADLYASDCPKEDRNQKFLGIELSKVAKARLSDQNIEPSILRVKILSLALTQFGTGISIAVAKLHFSRIDNKPLSALEFTEAMASIARFNNCVWLERKSGEVISDSRFSLGVLIRSLVSGSADKSIEARRVRSLCFARLASKVSGEAMETYAAFLSRRYTASYQFDFKNSDLGMIKDFENMRHALSIEGGASVIMPDESGDLPEILKNWQNSVFQNAYSPLALLLLHEEKFLTNARLVASEASFETVDMEELEEMVLNALDFRMFYRFESVSEISMHEAFSRKLRRALELGRKLSELEGDVKALYDRMSALQREEEQQLSRERNHRFYWVSMLTGPGITAATVFTVCKEALELTLGVSSGRLILSICFIAAGLSGCIAALIINAVGPSKPEQGRVTRAKKALLLSNMARILSK